MSSMLKFCCRAHKCRSLPIHFVSPALLATMFISVKCLLPISLLSFTTDAFVARMLLIMNIAIMKLKPLPLTLLMPMLAVLLLTMLEEMMLLLIRKINAESDFYNGIKHDLHCPTTNKKQK